MKKVLFPLVIVFLFTSQSFSQEDSIKNYPLKDYIAPDIRYRLLDLGSQLNLNGINQSETENFSNNYFRTNAKLNYYEYENLSNYQGTTNASFDLSYQAQWEKNEDKKQSYSSPRITLSSLSQSRFYNQNGTFWGIHGDINYQFSSSTYKEGEVNSKSQSHTFKITPYISFGNGRIEPVESARTALDILLALQESDRLGRKPDKEMIDSLSRVANRITYKRFYDSRFKRIYQLEELDKAIQNMDLVDTADIVYFANLSDIWNYAGRYNRGSGLRYEGGIIPNFSIVNNEHESSDTTYPHSNRKYNDKQYGIYGFFSFRRMKPISYSWQSDIMIDLTFGYEKNAGKEEEKGNNNDWESSCLKAMFNTGWQFGFYPNTRTYAGILPYAAVSFVRNLETNKNTFGVSTGFRFNSYYYVSPRLRLLFEAGFYYAENFDYSVPSLFWENFTERYINTRTSGGIPDMEKGFAYNLSFTLRYAIL